MVMQRSRAGMAGWALALVGALASPACALDDAPAPAKDVSPHPVKGRVASAKFPAPISKKLFADVDLRGKLAPALEVERWLGDKPEFKGKVVLVDFWATWCPPCRKLMPELEAWQAQFKDDLVIVGISDEAASVVEKFVAGKAHGYAMAVDTAAKMKKAVGVKGIPHVLIIGTDNVVRWQGFPGSAEDPLTSATIKAIIDADKARRAAAPDPAPTGGTDKSPTATDPAKPATPSPAPQDQAKPDQPKPDQPKRDQPKQAPTPRPGTP